MNTINKSLRYLIAGTGGVGGSIAGFLAKRYGGEIPTYLKMAEKFSTK